MGPSCVVVVDPDPHGETGVVDGLEAPRPAELLLEGFDEALAKTVPPGRVGRDVFLGETVVLDHGPVLARSEDQAVVVAQEHARRSVAQRSEAVEKRLLQGPFRGLGPARSFQGVAGDLAGAAIDDGHEDAPTVLAAVNQGQVCRPALVGRRGDRARCLHPGVVAGP